MAKHEIDPDHLEETGEGYFEQDHDVRDVQCEDDIDRCAPDDFEADPETGHGVPGTQDDLPYTLGDQRPNPADEHVVPDDAPVHASTRRHERDETGAQGDRDEADLWRAQKHLIQEDDEEGVRLEGFESEDVPEIMDALGEDAADALPDSPDGVSATGNGNEPKHGGFPEREK